MSTNKNSNINNGEKRLEEEKSNKVINKEKQNSEEKKQQNREKNKLRMQKHRANLSEEQKQQLREKERLKRHTDKIIIVVHGFQYSKFGMRITLAGIILFFKHSKELKYYD
jgi:hypothetical protein